MFTINIKKPFNNCRITIETNEKELANAIEIYYKEYIVGITSSNSIIVKVLKNSNQYVFIVGKSQRIVKNPLIEINNYIYQNSNVENGYFIAHAGTIIQNNKAYLFTAPSGVGKSTLMCYLAYNGYDCITDDYTIINMQTMEVMPFLTSIHLRKEGLQILNKKQVSIKTTRCFYNGFERYVVKNDSKISGPVAMKKIFILNRNSEQNQLIIPNNQTTLNNLSKCSAYPYEFIMNNIIFIKKLTGYFGGIIKYKDLSYISDIIMKQYI